MQRNCIHTGDCFDVLDDLDSESVHAVVTDPPYGLAFMGRDWDDFEPKEYQQWCEKWARACNRVLKPGGHLLAFSGNRTHHRAFTGVEDAGFEIRDTLTWHYGSGFPKASDISKTIDKRADVDREVVAERPQRANSDNSNVNYNKSNGETEKITKPATPEAEKWDGWKTGLKPATEYIVMARKPFDGATVDCVLEHGTGALNIEGCRVETDERPERGGENNGSDSVFGQVQGSNYAAGTTTKGRYPSNVVFDETAAAALDEQVGACPSDGIDFSETEDNQNREKYGEYSGERTQSYEYDDSHDGPSRYFYTSKASKNERTNGGDIANSHPTVKPTDLMEWLVRLVTREGQVVLDPFVGSGTTCMAAKEVGREFVGIEQQAQWADVARARCGLAPEDPATVRERDDQTGLEAFQ